ncbi:hypothetical protein C0Q70_18534 [Pomacea canaliculata]|uniref:Uncharacterized protein n=1 Tax=Pomacea canaliculata TaxID=400727 RepID=A0A2T7NGT2_POMCA|nr:hypothetical protein C0Q70_18534 [Pomacea canaliculata]
MLLRLRHIHQSQGMLRAAGRWADPLSVAGLWNLSHHGRPGVRRTRDGRAAVGGEHAYLLYTFNPKEKKGGIGRVPAFLYDWMGCFIIRPTMFAIISLAFGLYVVKPFFPDCQPAAAAGQDGHRSRHV